MQLSRPNVSTLNNCCDGSSQYDINNENIEERIMAVIDYISGITLR